MSWKLKEIKYQFLLKDLAHIIGVHIRLISTLPSYLFVYLSEEL